MSVLVNKEVQACLKHQWIPLDKLAHLRSKRPYYCYCCCCYYCIIFVIILLLIIINLPPDHNECMVSLRALRNRQDLFQEEGILNLILDAIDKITVITSQGVMVALAGKESGLDWDIISGEWKQLHSPHNTGEKGWKVCWHCILNPQYTKIEFRKKQQQQSLLHF